METFSKGMSLFLTSFLRSHLSLVEERSGADPSAVQGKQASLPTYLPTYLRTYVRTSQPPLTYSLTHSSTIHTTIHAIHAIQTIRRPDWFIV